MSGFLKFIAPLVHPVGFAWLLLLVAAGISLRRRRKLGSGVCLASAAIVWLLSQPCIVTPLIGSLERPWLDHTLDRAPAADAVIVLGGGWRPSRGDFAGIDLTQAGDRIIVGFELCRIGRVGALAVGGDSGASQAGGGSESEHLRQWMKDWGLGHAEFMTLGPVVNTRDEAARTAELVARRGWQSVLLVTSALHMRRSMAAFARAGVTVHPVACDFQVLRVPNAAGSWKLFPDEEAFTTFGLWWHEQLGWLAYRLFGYL